MDDFDEKSDEVYIIIDNDERVIFLWKGVDAGIRQKFIGSRATGDKRKDRGYHYKIEVMDEGDETTSFIKFIRGGEVEEPEKIVSAEPDAEGDEEFSSYAEAAAAQGIEISDDEIKSKTEMKGGPAPERVKKMGGIGQRPQKSFLSDPNFFQDMKEDKKTRETVSAVVQETNKEDAVKIINALGSPKGFDREMLIVGRSVYRVVIEEDEYTLEDLENPLDGVIMVSQYTPRLLCENGRVKAVELLKQISEDIEVDESLTQDLEDLTAMFQIEIDQ